MLSNQLSIVLCNVKSGSIISRRAVTSGVGCELVAAAGVGVNGLAGAGFSASAAALAYVVSISTVY